MNRLRRFIHDLGRVPTIPLIGFPGIQLTGVSIRQALTDARTQTETLLRLFDHVRPDALFTMMDLTIEAEYLGCSLKFSDNDPPAVAASLVQDAPDVEAIFAGKTVGGRMPLFAEVVNRLRDGLDVPVCAYVIGPLTLTGEIMEITRVMKATRKDPGLLHQVLGHATGLIKNYVALLEAAGASLICILEPSAMMISANLFYEFSGQYCRQIIADSISGMSVLHICGNTNHLIHEMERAGANGLSLDHQVDLPQIRATLNADTVLIGNLDPVGVITFDDPVSIQKKSRALLEAMASDSNFIFSTGCDVPPNAPIQNIKAMMAAVF